MQAPLFERFSSLGTVPSSLGPPDSSAFFSLRFTWTLPDPFMMGKPFNLTLVGEKIILKLVKIIRKTVFKGIALGSVKITAVGEKDQVQF